MYHGLQPNEHSSDEGESHLTLSCLSPDNSSVKKKTKKTQQERLKSSFKIVQDPGNSPSKINSKLINLWRLKDFSI